MSLKPRAERDFFSDAAIPRDCMRSFKAELVLVRETPRTSLLAHHGRRCGVAAAVRAMTIPSNAAP